MPIDEMITPEARRALTDLFVRLKRETSEVAEEEARGVIKPLVTNGGTQIHPHAGGDRNLVFTQAVAATTWTVTHNFGKFPSVTILDVSNVQIVGLVTHTSINALTIQFNTALTGKAVLN